MDKNFSNNADKMNVLIADLHKNLQEVYLGGGVKKIEKLHQQNKLTARERIDLLLDKDSERFEIGALAGWEMYEEHGGCPAGGVVAVVACVVNVRGRSQHRCALRQPTGLVVVFAFGVPQHCVAEHGGRRVAAGGVAVVAVVAAVVQQQADAGRRSGRGPRSGRSKRRSPCTGLST